MIRLLLGIVLVLGVVPWAVAAEAYPSKPIKIVVPYPPGGAIDILARYIAVPLGKALDQSVIVENKSGASGLVGHGYVAKSAPDGYTLVIAAAGPVAASIKLYKTMPYDATRDFTPVGMVADVDVVLVAGPGHGFKSVEEVREYARANPGKLKFAINSPGSLHHLLTEHFLSVAALSANRVPYKGAGQAVIDLLGGQTDVEMESLPVVAEYIKAKRLNALAVASPHRLSSLPHVPTFGELGLNDMVAAPWYALLAPAGTPPQIVERLNTELNKILSDEATQRAFARLGVRPVVASAAQTQQFIAAETDRWGRVVTQSKIQMN